MSGEATDAPLEYARPAIARRHAVQTPVIEGVAVGSPGPGVINPIWMRDTPDAEGQS
jgi:hypothetical protein